MPKVNSHIKWTWLLATTSLMLTLTLIAQSFPVAGIRVIFLSSLVAIPASLLLWIHSFVVPEQTRKFTKFTAAGLLLFGPAGLFGTTILWEGSDEFLHRAARRGQTQWLVQLLDSGNHGPDVVDTHGNSLLMKAAQYGHTDTVQELLQRGARTNYRDGDGDTALTIAERYKHLEIVTLLKAAGAHR